MKTKKNLHALIVIQVVLFSSLIFAPKAYSEVDLKLAMYALQVSAGLRTASPQMTINVPADATTIQEAIDAAIDNTKIIVAEGTYTENLTIEDKTNLTIEGIGSVAGSPMTVISGTSNDPVTGDSLISINNSKATFTGIVITTAKYGVVGGNTSKILIEDSRIEQNNIGAILWGASAIWCKNIKVTQNTYMGLNLSGSSSLLIEDSEVSNNTSYGIIVHNNSGSIVKVCSINNNGVGLMAQAGSAAEFWNSQISANTSFGIHAIANAAIHLFGGNTISNNSGGGVNINHSSSIVQYDAGGGPDNITSNAIYGINLYGSSSGALQQGTIIDSNTGNGTQLLQNSSVYITSGASITNHSGGVGILFDSTSSFAIPKAPAALANISGNGAATFCTNCSDFGPNDLDGDGHRQVEYTFDIGSMSYINVGDCNDGDINIYPGATEICDDGVDNNCNGVQNDDGCLVLVPVP